MLTWLGRAISRPAVARSGAGGPARCPALGVTRLEEREMPAGVLDPTFGTGGKTTTPFDLVPGGDDRPAAVAIDAAGRTVVAGTVVVGPGALPGSISTDFAVARYTPNGHLDPTFGTGGKVVIPFDVVARGNDRATAVAIDSQGRIVVAGAAQMTALAFGAVNDTDMAVARLRPDGSLDTAFSHTGKRTVPFNLGGWKQDDAACVAVDAQDRIVLAGSTERSAAGDVDFATARLTTAGPLDPTYNGNGKRVVYFNLPGVAGNEQATGIAIDSKGRVVVGGLAERGGEYINDTDFAAARITPDGRMDAAFSGDGKVLVALNRGGFNTDVARCVAVDAQDRVVLGGTSQSGATKYDFAVVRLTAAGTPDPTFDKDGKRFVVFTYSAPYTVAEITAPAVRVDSAGRVLLGGTVRRRNSGERIRCVVIRLTPGGALDASFGANHGGSAVLPLAPDEGNNLLTGLAVDAADRVYIAGGFFNSVSKYDFGVARLA